MHDTARFDVPGNAFPMSMPEESRGIGTLQLARSLLSAPPLPLVISPSVESVPARLDDWIAALTSQLDQLNTELLQHGALLLRNFPIHDPDDMARVVSLFGTGMLDYVGGAVPRSQVKGRIFNSTELNRHFRIRIHNELSYQRKFPRLICFFCHTPSATGGETIVADCRNILKDIPANIVEDFRRKKVRYTRVLQNEKPMREFVKKLVPTYFHMTWQQVFRTGDRQEVDAACAHLDIDHTWRANGDLEMTSILPAVVNPSGTGDEVWFSHLNLFFPSPRVLGWPVYLSRKLTYRRVEDTPYQISYGDGSSIPPTIANRIFDAIEKNTVFFSWQQGDLMIIDNRLVGHGRNPYSGKRSVLVTMHD